MIRRNRRFGLSSKQREQLYESETAKARVDGRGEYPICNICQFQILPGREWDISHDPTKPRWLGGAVTGIAHRKCNRQHASQRDVPLFAKSERVRKRHLDFTRSATPLPGGRDDGLKRRLNGQTVPRANAKSWGEQ